MNNLQEHVEYIDEVFGEGYAKEHPELVGASIHAHTMFCSAKKIAEAIDGVGYQLREIGVNMVTPKMGQALDGLASLAHGFVVELGGLEEIANAIDPDGLRHIREAAMYATPNEANGGKRDE
jgi:hypothetical protein